MARGTASVDADVYRQPDPALVARIIDVYGFEAAATRWHWLGSRSLCQLAQSARAAEGRASAYATPKRRSYDDLAAAVCVEAAYALGSLTRGERAAGIRKVGGRGIFASRGLTPPSISPEGRAEATRLALGTKNGNADAAASWEARLQHELAVGAVLRAALAFVPEQPATGRYRLPPCDDRLREALAGLPEAAVRAVFPNLDLSAPVQPEETTVPETADRPAQPHRRAPDDATLRSDHIAGGTLVEIAAGYGIGPGSLYSHWSRLGLSARGRLAGYEEAKRTRRQAEEKPQNRRRVPDDATLRTDHATGTSGRELAGRYGVNPVTLYSHWARLGLASPGADPGYQAARAARRRAEAWAATAPAPVATPQPPSPSPSPAPAPARLSLEDLALAAGLVRQGVRAEEAVALVRADRAAVAGASERVIAAWFDALAETGLAETEAEKAAAEARYASACQAFGGPQ